MALSLMATYQHYFVQKISTENLTWTYEILVLIHAPLEILMATLALYRYNNSSQ